MASVDEPGKHSAVDASTGLTLDAPVAVPPAQTLGPCTSDGYQMPGNNRQV